jgi:uncharacterized protein
LEILLQCILASIKPPYMINPPTALLKIITFFGLWLLLWLPIAIPLAIALKWRPPQPLSPNQKLPLLASLYLLAPLVLWIFAIDHSFAAYGFPWKFSVLMSLGQGLILGVVGLVLLFGVELALGWVKGQAVSWEALPQLGTTLATTLFLGLWVGLTEELIFRGFLWNQWQMITSPIAAAAIASAIFALLHLVWEGRANIPQLPGLWLMGMVLTLARSVDGGNLGLAWGLHAGWIWAIATLDTAQLIRPTGKISPWLTGWADQPLAGVMGILFLLGTAGFLLGAAGFFPVTLEQNPIY